jgi:hypothetical protein
MDFDLIVRNATLPDGRKGQDVAVAAGRITAVAPKIEAEANRVEGPPDGLAAGQRRAVHGHMGEVERLQERHVCVGADRKPVGVRAITLLVSMCMAML